jgi:hypothetical protein
MQGDRMNKPSLQGPKEWHNILEMASFLCFQIWHDAKMTTYEKKGYAKN